MREFEQIFKKRSHFLAHAHVTRGVDNIKIIDQFDAKDKHGTRISLKIYLILLLYFLKRLTYRFFSCDERGHVKL